LHDFAGFFGMSYAAQNGQIIHNLRTAIITPDGRLAEFYTGNQWKPEEVAARLAQLQK
jgi:protein SCO1/2